MEKLLLECINIQILLNYIEFIPIWTINPTSSTSSKIISPQLEHILNLTIQNKIKNCSYPNTQENSFSYFYDHSCRKEEIPYKKANSIEIY